MSDVRRVLTLLIALVLFVAIAAAYLVGARADASDEREPVTRDPAARGFMAPGTGTVTAVPDQLSFDVSVTHHDADSVRAMNETSAGIRRVRKALTGAGVARKDIRTASVDVRPTYRYEKGRTIFTGFSSTQGLRVLVRDLPSAGKVLSKAAVAVENSGRIGDISMEIGDRSALIEEARTKAVEDARSAAQTFAAATGRKVGAVLYVEEAVVNPNRYRDYVRTGLSLDAFAAQAVPIEAGEQEVTVNVKVRWAID